jgi:hypothetical protein
LQRWSELGFTQTDTGIRRNDQVVAGSERKQRLLDLVAKSLAGISAGETQEVESEFPGLPDRWQSVFSLGSPAASVWSEYQQEHCKSTDGLAHTIPWEAP